MPDKATRLGSEDRVFRPYPLSEVTILALGKTSYRWAQNKYLRPRKAEPGHEVWVMNGAAAVFQHDVVFNMHDLEELAKCEPDKDFIGLYESHDKPVVTIRAIPGVDNLYEYPLSEVIAEFQQNYFANGASYLIAFALLCGVSKINIYGCDFDYPNRSDYEAGRCNFEFWLGYARAKGVQIAVPQESTLMDTIYRLDGKGRIGYGAVYGYFDRQPVFAEDGNGVVSLVNFSSPPSSFENVEAGVQTIRKEKAIP